VVVVDVVGEVVVVGVGTVLFWYSIHSQVKTFHKSAVGQIL
jgi:hypothetical protein